MKLKAIIISLIFVISLMIVGCGTAPENTDTGKVPDNTDTQTDTQIQEKPYTKVEGAIQPRVSYKAVKKSFLEKVLYYYGRHEYIGADLPKDFGDYYKIVKTYEDFVPLTEACYIPKSVFETNYVLIIHRSYGGRYKTDMGFSNFKVENGEASIDLYEYTGSLCYPDINFFQTEYYLIPNTCEYEADEFAPIKINKTTVYSYESEGIDIDGLELGERALIFDGKEAFSSFIEQYGVTNSYISSSDDSYYIIIEAPFSDIASISNLTLSGDKLTITVDDSGLSDWYQERYVAIRVPKNRYSVENEDADLSEESYREKIPSDVSLEIILNENSQPNDEEINNALNNRHTMVDGAAYPTLTTSSENRDFYPQLIYELGRYLGNDLMDLGYGDFYKVVKEYDELVGLFENGTYINKEVFDTSYVLIVHRRYGSRPPIQVGFSNFQVQDGKAQIDLYEYTGSGLVNCDEFSSMEIILIPNTEEHDAQSFKPININRTTVYSYTTECADIDGLRLNGEALVFNDLESYNEFADDYGTKKFMGYESKVLIIPTPHKSIVSCGYLTLDGDKLTLKFDKDQWNESLCDKEYLIIRVENEKRGIDVPNQTSQPGVFCENITSEMELCVVIHEDNCPITPNYLSKDEFVAVMQSKQLNQTTRVDKLILKDDGTLTYGSQITERYHALYYTYNTVRNENADLAVTVSSDAYFLDMFVGHEYSMEIENGKWVKNDGLNICHSSIFDHFNISNLQNHYSELSYDWASGAYYADEINDQGQILRDVKLKIENGCVVYASFRDDGTYEGAKEEYVVITVYDIGRTEAVEILDGSDAELDEIAISEEIQEELEKIR
ncbi:MAG: hypothetical protein IJC80_00055 [Clostridia bacterium]|nr:hypothetical protein [Clostridia bacterium]